MSHGMQQKKRHAMDGINIYEDDTGFVDINCMKTKKQILFLGNGTRKRYDRTVSTYG